MFSDGPDELGLVVIFVVTFLATVGFWALLGVILDMA
ncbi:hypothetical protein JTF60_gp03 [Microbacterium phage Efeko]|uniref:Uncharacterized protein n=1 Tax=Microbacterium phage Efeko TaxID=2315704 RepID=A0A386KLM4_9CAUD|nr:hypothetical protein JTF60_gp03 [Microbacterium phage Efeko]AYD86250.1 hypothetical protein SEA_EFEKO_3 [Microbacterium phage Efeko]